MKPLRSYSSEEIARLPSSVWLRAELYANTVRELEREMSLMFSPDDHLAMVRERDRAEDLAALYERALKSIAGAVGREINGEARAVEELAKAVVERLLAARALEAKKKK